MTPIKWNGEIIREPGLYADIPIDTYHQNPFLCDEPSISSTGMKQFIERPSLYWAYSPYNRNRQEFVSKPHFNFGKAAHHIVGREGNFTKFFALRPDTYPNNPAKKWNSNSTDCRVWLEEQESQGRTVITFKDMEAICDIVQRLEERVEVANGLLDGMIETSMFAKFGKIWLRSRPDFQPVSDGDYVDTKFVASVDYLALQKAIYQFGYHIQAAICRMVAREIFGEDHPFSYALCFVEKTPPYDVHIHQLDSASLELGERQVRTAIRYMHKCIETWKWPTSEGFNPIISNIGIPAWASTHIETEIAYMEGELKS
jgi:hypothetical protein